MPAQREPRITYFRAPVSILAAVDAQHSACFQTMTNISNSLIRLQQRLLLRLLVNPFGKGPRIMELDGDHLRIGKSGGTSSVSLAVLSSPPVVRKWVLGSMLTVSFCGPVALA